MSTKKEIPDAIRLRWSAALDEAAIRSLVNVNTFTRGTTYATSGAVSLNPADAADDGLTVSATVAGTKDYQTRLELGEDDELFGNCTCENAQAGWFCKHQVALALVWRAELEGTPLTLDPVAQKKVAAAAKRAHTVQSNAEALRSFLKAQDASALADKLIELGERDSGVQRELQQWRKIVAAKANPDDLKALVGEILGSGRGFLDWRESREYRVRAWAVIPVLQRAREQNAQSAIALTLHALRRSWAVLENADDSNGDIGDVCRAIGAEWVAAIAAAGAQPAAFGDSYLKVMVEDPFGAFDSDAVEAAMGTPALSRYRTLLAAEWQKAAAAQAPDGGSEGKGGRSRPTFISESYIRMKTLERLHMRQLEAAGDHAGVLAMLRAAALGRNGYGEGLQIVNYLDKIGRQREALAEAEALAKKEPDNWQVENFLVQAYERDGCHDEVLAIHRKHFDAQPSAQGFQTVLNAAKKAGRDITAMREALWSALAERELQRQKKPVSPLDRVYAGSRGMATGKSRERDVTVRAEILCAERAWLDALALVQPPNACASEPMLRLARHLPETHAEDAVKLLLRVFTATMPDAQTPYKDELAIVHDIGKRMPPDQRAAWFASLRQQYRAKRNFIAGLPVDG